MPLTNTEVKNAKPRDKQYRLTDGQAMYLLVMPSGKKYWRLDYSIHGKRKTYAIGSYPTVSLRDARVKRDEARRLISEGVDPVQHRQLTKSQRADAVQNSFQSVAMEWFAKQEHGWAPSHARTISGRLDLNLLPWLGNRPITEITTPEILRVLRRIEDRGAIVTAHRCKTICSQVFRYAIAAGLADRDPAADLKGVLAPHQPQKMAAITDPDQVGALMRAIRGYQGDIITRCALQFSAMTFCRPGEIRHAEWSEINWIKRLWEIPEGKMKMKRDHTVPLSDQAIQVLQEIHPLTGQGKYIFPSLRTDTRPMSNNTILAALRRMGFTKEEMTGHGFRSMASTLLHESGKFEHHDIELQLAHSVGSKVSAAYNRFQRLPERKKMMQWYSDYLEELEQGETGSRKAMHE